jgi:hypothetical protein
MSVAHLKLLLAIATLVVGVAAWLVAAQYLSEVL